MKHCKSILITGFLVLALVLSGVLVTVFCSVPLRTIRASMVHQTVLQTDTLVLERDRPIPWSWSGTGCGCGSGTWMAGRPT